MTNVIEGQFVEIDESDDHQVELPADKTATPVNELEFDDELDLSNAPTTALSVLPEKHSKSKGLTPVPTVSIRGIFRPKVTNEKSLVSHSYKFHNVDVTVTSLPLDVNTDFAVLGKILHAVSDRDVSSGEEFTLPLSDFKELSLDLKLSYGKAGFIRLKNSLERLLTLKVSMSNNELRAYRGLNAFSELSFDPDKKELLITCTPNLAKWYRDSYKQILIGQYNQIDSAYARSLYLYLESYKVAENESFTTYARTLRNMWYSEQLSQLSGKSNRKKLVERVRKINLYIVAAFEQLDSLQYFTRYSVEQRTGPDGLADIKFTFVKSKRLVRERIERVGNIGDVSDDLSLEEILDQGVLVKPTKSRLPKRPYPLDDLEHIDELKEWAFKTYVILQKYSNDIFEFNGSKLVTRDRKTFETVIDYLKATGFKFSNTDYLKTLAPKVKKSKKSASDVIQREKLLQEKDKIIHELINSAAVMSSLDKNEISHESEPYLQALEFSPVSKNRLAEIDKLLDKLEG